MKHLKAQKEILDVSPQVKAQGFYLGGNTQLTALLIGTESMKEKTLTKGKNLCASILNIRENHMK